MASRIRTLVNKLFGTSEYRALIVGLDASGKTTILYKLKLGEVVCTIPTIGFNVETVTYKSISWTLWDVGGCDKIRPLIRHYFQNMQALIFVIDSNDSQRLPEVRVELDRLLLAEELRNAPILIYLNKMDLPNRMSPNTIIEKLELNTIRGKAWYAQSCCAVTGDGLYEGFDWLFNAMKRPNSLRPQNEPLEPPIAAMKISENNQDETKAVEWLSHIDSDTNEEFIESFEKHRLPVEIFDHRTLLRTIWVGLTLYGRKQTIKILFDHLKIYITDMNETLVYFWIQIVHYAFETTKNPSHDFTGFLLMNPQLLNENDLPLSYFKKETLFSTKAKTTVVLPDVKQLPSILPASSASNTTSHQEKKSDSAIELTPDDLDDDEFLKQFEGVTLQSWSHKTHVRMAWLYLSRDGRRVGVNKIFDGIKKFIQNSSIARKTTFHFTMTYFWIQMIDLAIAQSPTGITFEEFLRLNPHLLNGGLFLEYYKKETMLNNPIAREQMVLPDIKPLPTMISSSNKK